MEADFWRRSGLKKPKLREADSDDGNDTQDSGDWFGDWLDQLRRRVRREEDDAQRALDVIRNEEPPEEEPHRVTEPPLTRGEVKDIEGALKELGLDEEGNNRFADVLYESMKTAATSGHESAQELLHVKTSDFSIVPTWTLDQMKGYSKQLGFLAVERERLVLAQAIELAIHNGDSAKMLSREIQEIFKEGYHVIGKGGEVTRRMVTGAWSNAVARTELSRASNAGSMAFYIASGVKKIQWVAADSESTCLVCHEADGEVVNIGDDFPFVEVPSPPVHPNCVCSTIPADEELGIPRGTDEEIARAKRGGYTSEEYEQKFGVKHKIDREGPWNVR